MSHSGEAGKLRQEIHFLEGKCLFLTKKLEEAILSNQGTKRAGVVYDVELQQLRIENERLRKKIHFLRNSVSWVITKPLRLINIRTVDKWWRKRRGLPFEK
ncbi:MAG: hypothetical protein WBX11_18350 [Thiobacillaceae bacterium]